MRKLLLVTACTVALGACGFTPMYGTAFQDENAISIVKELEHIEISNVKDRSGQFLRNALIDRFYKTGRPATPKYKLDIAPISEGIVGLDITKTSDTTRSQLHLQTSIKLTDLETNEEVLKRDIYARASFNELTSEFATRVSEQNTRENTLNELARQIELQIGLHFKR